MAREQRSRRTRLFKRAAVALVVGGALFCAALVGAHSLAGANAARATTGPSNPFATRAMRAYLDQRHGNIAAAVYDVATGATYLYRPDDREQTGSIVKVDMLATLLHEEQAEGEGLSYGEEVTATGMIEQSDNDDANDLWAAVGGASAVGAFDRSIGMTRTHPNTEGYWGETSTTARDQLQLLRYVFLRNEVLHAPARDYVRYLMENITPWEDWGVSAGPPAAVTVALKNGWVPIVGDDWQVNSIGMVHGDGRHYLIALLTNHDNGEQYGIATIEHISRIVWRTLGRNDAKQPSGASG
jgi:beta-lactamase class A